MKYLCFSTLLLLIACAPKVAPPPEYIEEEFSLEEVIHKAGGDIEVLKAIADIRIEKDGEPYDFVNASVLIKKPGSVHMRIYKFGMLVRDFVIKDQELYVLSGKNSGNLKNLGDEFYNAIFWWDKMEDAVLHSDGNEYIITAPDKKLRIEKATLIPIQQNIIAFDREIEIQYSAPKKEEDGFWYPSFIEIFLGEFKFNVTLKKLLKNPDLGEFDFKTAGNN